MSEMVSKLKNDTYETLDAVNKEMNINKDQDCQKYNAV